MLNPVNQKVRTGMARIGIPEYPEKYYGSADYEVRGKQFILTVMMQKGDAGQ